MLAGVAVPHQGTKDHFRQERIGDRLFDDFARRHRKARLADVVVVFNLRDKAPPVVDLSGKMLGDLRREALEIVREP